MSKLPRRSKRSRRVRKINGIDPDMQLTPEQACAYAAKRDVHININILKLLRRDGKGPQFLRVEGRFIRYTPHFLDPFIEARLPRVIDPSQRRK